MSTSATQETANDGHEPAGPRALEGYANSLGRALEHAWAARRFHVATFPEVAAHCLKEVEPPSALDPATILRTVAASRNLLPQEDPKSRFGHPPITLYRGRDFFVSALFWLDGTTAIHDHAFSGAFRVLCGGSIHAPYSFDVQEEVTHRLRLGTLQLEGPELLGVSDVRPIEPGSRFIHALFHLERPSVTIVVRTYGDSGQPQLRYLRPGLAYDSFYRDDVLERRFESVITLAEMDRDAGVSAACELIDGEDLWAGFLLANKWFWKLGRGEDFERVLNALARRHGTVTESFSDMFQQLQRTHLIATRRRMLTEPEHRLFLALLLNLPDRRSVDAILARRFPESDPGALLSRWVSELAAPERRGISGLVMDDTTAAEVTRALRAGQTNALSSIGLKTPTMLEDLFQA